MTTATDRQLQVLAFVADFHAREGVPPTVREISTHFGWASARATTCHLEALERHGLLVRKLGARRIHVTTDGHAQLEARSATP